MTLLPFQSTTRFTCDLELDAGARAVKPFIAFDQFDRQTFRKRLAKMTDSELIRQGTAAREMCKVGFGESPRETFIIQLQECREEWKRRHPK